MSSKKFADKMIIFLTKYKNYSETDKKIVHYGLETIYIFITKLLFITIISLFFGITKEMYIYMVLYFFLRHYSSGLHLATSHGCTIFSSLLFISLPIICKSVNLNIFTRFVLGIASTIVFALFSPADTHKKPILNKEKRKKLKLKSLTICIIYLTLLLFLKNEFILNCITISMVMQGFLISPIAYKIFKQPYNNYKNYK